MSYSWGSIKNLQDHMNDAFFNTKKYKALFGDCIHQAWYIISKKCINSSITVHLFMLYKNHKFPNEKKK